MKTNSKFNRYHSVFSAVILVMFLLVSCGSQAPAAVNPPTEQPIAIAEAVNTEAPAAVVQAADPTLPAATQTPEPVAEMVGIVGFSKDILPMLEKSCVSCHGGEKTSKGLDLKTYESIMSGSQNGPVIVAGDSAKSLLVKSIQAGKMPKKGTKFTADQIKLIEDWVNAGALNN